ncbi:MAG: hypothetical protein LUG85_00265 [Clostridiales bacterium]|nr:hypothetical protein [Clostridiales bacterium]
MKGFRKPLSFILSLVLMLGCFAVFGTSTASAASYNWAGSWGSPAIDMGVVLGYGSVFSENGILLKDFIPANSTIRATVTPTLGGEKIRLKFSNYFGTETVTFNEVTVAKTGETDDEIDTSTVTQITFNGGSTSVNIAAGSEVYSDEITFSFEALEKLSVSIYFRSSTYMYVAALYGGTCYLCSSLGNRTHSENVTAVASKLTFTSGSITYNTIPFLTRIDAYAENAYSVVIAGDSTVTNDSYLLLAQKLISNGITNVGIVMSGIVGNSLMHDGVGLMGKAYGTSLLGRYERDALSVAGVKYIIIKIGVNDVLHPTSNSLKDYLDEVSSNDLVKGYKQLSKLAENYSVQTYLCTRTPYKGYTRNFMGDDDITWSAAAEQTFQEVNSWIRNTAVTGGYFTGCIDLDYMRDPNDSTQFRSQLTSDGAHLSYYGQIAFVDLIPEAAYGVSRDLTDIAAILNINPYDSSLASTSTSTSSGSSSSSGSGSSSSSGSGSSAASTITGAIGSILSGSDSDDSDSSDSSSDGSTTSSSSDTATSSSDITTVGSIASIITSAEATTTSGANQILVDDSASEDSVSTGTVTDETSSSAKRQLAGFIILAVVSAGVIIFAGVMLLKLRSPKASLSRSSYGTVKKKKRA